MFDETKHILLHGSADNAIVKFTSTPDARNVRLLSAHTLEDAYATRQLHRQ